MSPAFIRSFAVALSLSLGLSSYSPPQSTTNQSAYQRYHRVFSTKTLAFSGLRAFRYSLKQTSKTVPTLSSVALISGFSTTPHHVGDSTGLPGIGAVFAAMAMGIYALSSIFAEPASRHGRRISTGGIALKSSGKTISLEGTHRVIMSPDFQIPEIGNENATEIVNRSLRQIKERRFFSDQALEDLVNKGIGIQIVESSQYLTALYENAEGDLTIEIDAFALQQNNDEPALRNFLVHQLSHLFDRLLLEDFLTDRDILIREPEKEGMLIYRDAERINRDAHERRDLLRYLDTRSGEQKRRLDPKNTYTKLLESEDFFEVGSNERPIWVEAIKSYIVSLIRLHNLYPLSYVNELEWPFEHFLIILRLYKDSLRHWQTPQLSSHGSIKFVFDASVERSRREGFKRLFNEQLFLKETFTSIYPNMPFGDLTVLEIASKVYVRRLGSGRYKTGYYLQVVPTGASGITHPLECVLLLYSPFADDIDPLTPGEDLWQKRIPLHESNLVPGFSALRLSKPFIFHEDHEGEQENIPVLSAPYAGEDISILLNSQRIPENGQRRLLRFAMSKYIRLYLRMGGSRSIGDPKLANICSLDWKLRIVDLGDRIGFEHQQGTHVDPAYLLWFAMEERDEMHLWNAPISPELVSVRATSPMDLSDIKNRWTTLSQDPNMHPAKIPVIAETGLPSTITIKDLSKSRVVRIAEALLKYKGPLSDDVLVLVKTLSSIHRATPQGVLPSIDTENSWRNQLIFLRTMTYDKNYLFDGVIDVFTRSSDDHISLSDRYRAGIAFLERIARTQDPSMRPVVDAINDYFQQLKLKQHSYTFPAKESNRPPLGDINWMDISKRWQTINDRWNAGSLPLKNKFGPELNMDTYHLVIEISTPALLEGKDMHSLVRGKRLKDMRKNELAYLIEGIKGSFYTPSDETLCLLRALHDKFGKTPLPTKFTSRGIFNDFLDRLSREISRSPDDNHFGIAGMVPTVILSYALIPSAIVLIPFLNLLINENTAQIIKDGSVLLAPFTVWQQFWASLSINALQKHLLRRFARVKQAA